MVQMVYAMYACKWDSEKTFSFLRSLKFSWKLESEKDREVGQIHGLPRMVQGRLWRPRRRSRSIRAPWCWDRALKRRASQPLPTCPLSHLSHMFIAFWRGSMWFETISFEYVWVSNPTLSPILAPGWIFICIHNFCPTDPLRSPLGGERGGFFTDTLFTPGMGKLINVFDLILSCCGIANPSFVPQLLTQWYFVSLYPTTSMRRKEKSVSGIDRVFLKMFGV